MMAGEIGASVVVVKEIEVPFGMVELVARAGGGEGKRRGKGKVEDGDTDTEVQTETETETESPSDTDGDDLSGTVVLERDALFAMDLESDFDESASQPRFAIDLEIASVFKPRPVRTRVHNHLHVAGNGGGKNKKVKKPKHLMPLSGNEHERGSGDGDEDAMERNKAHNRRQARDRKREEKRKALTAFAAQSVAVPVGSTQVAAVDLDSSVIVHGLEQMHVTIEAPATLTVSSDDITFTGVEISSTGVEVSSQTISAIDISLEIQQDEDDDDDVFAPPTTATPFSTFPTAPGGESFLNAPATALAFPAAFSSGAGSAMNGGKAEKGETRLIVEALVVRKMSLEEAFLDFGGFSLT